MTAITDTQRPRPLVTFADLEPHHCRWPVGTPRTAAFGFCGADRMEASPYCRHHQAAAHAARGAAEAGSDRR